MFKCLYPGHSNVYDTQQSSPLPILVRNAKRRYGASYGIGPLKTNLNQQKHTLLL
jgi:hypothetical protein